MIYTPEELERLREDWLDAEKAKAEAEIDYDSAWAWWNKRRNEAEKLRKEYGLATGRYREEEKVEDTFISKSDEEISDPDSTKYLNESDL